MRTVSFIQAYFCSKEIFVSCWDKMNFSCKSRLLCADCGKFWECSPQGPCLFECPDCGGVPQCIAYGSNQLQERLSFDCRSEQPRMELLMQLLVSGILQH